MRQWPISPDQKLLNPLSKRKMSPPLGPRRQNPVVRTLPLTLANQKRQLIMFRPWPLEYTTNRETKMCDVLVGLPGLPWDHQRRDGPKDPQHTAINIISGEASNVATTLPTTTIIATIHGTRIGNATSIATRTTIATATNCAATHPSSSMLPPFQRPVLLPLPSPLPLLLLCLMLLILLVLHELRQCCQHRRY